ncbi:MAG: DNA recombination protein RmuC [Sulfuricellaceae bacterium]|nr:DNA recombination protein RmuC [Sulfuricellaceae bacterium]
MLEILIAILIFAILLAALWVGIKLGGLTHSQHALPDYLSRVLEEKHRAMLSDLHEGLTKQGDRINQALSQSSERLRDSVAQELKQTRDAMQSLQLAQNDNLAQTREAMLKQLAELSAALQGKQDAMRVEVITKTMQTLAEQGRADQELIQITMKHSTQQLVTTIEGLSKTVDGRLEEISGKVTERLDEGFKKTNETFANVMARLATIDEAQKKIDGLTTNVVSLQELLGDKRSRGAFGEVQLENLIRNILPPTMYAMQYTLSTGSRVDCALFLPEPTGTVAVDSKFPLENYHRMFTPGVSELDRAVAQKQFKADVRKHVDDIAGKYIIANETSDGAVMFIPAEAVFAEIHAYHGDVVDYAMSKRVWIVSPTTMMAVLNTARAVMKDVETRKQVHIIKDALNKLGKEFERFDTRMKKLADHIRLAHDDALEVHTTSKKISDRFRKIEAVELDHPQQDVLEVLEGE